MSDKSSHNKQNAAPSDDSPEFYEGTLMDGLENEPPYPSAAIKHPKPPTPKQLAAAADIATRFAETAVLSSEDYSAVRRAAATMGVAALAKGNRG